MAMAAVEFAEPASESQLEALAEKLRARNFEVVIVNDGAEEGQIVVTSASGSQIGPIASGAGQLILVIGSQKIVPDLDTAFRRIREHVFPYEDARLRETMGVGTKITRTLILDQDFMPGR